MSAGGVVVPFGYFRIARNPSRIDAERCDHLLRADFPLLIAICRQHVRRSPPIVKSLR
jgi:hypothetical protein